MPKKALFDMRRYKKSSFSELFCSLFTALRIREKDIKRYNNKGIFTVKQLSYTFRPRRRGKRVKTKQHLYYHSLRALAIREQKVFLYDKTDMPDVKTKIYIDMEGNTDGSFIYLIGVLIVQNDKEKMHSLWANNPSDEEKIFAKLITILAEYNDGYVFYFGKYESKVFKRKLKSNPSIRIENLMFNKSTNVLNLIYSNIYFPTYSNELKEIGKYLGCSWSASNPSGIQSIVWRKKWECSKDTKLKNILIRYNYEDCVALKTITDFLYSIYNNKDSNKQLKKISYVKDIKSSPDGRPRYGRMNAVSKDIEVITKCAYFEYQRNRIFFRKNKKIRKNIKRKKKKIKFKWKPNTQVELVRDTCIYCGSYNITLGMPYIHCRTCLDLRFTQSGIKKWVTEYITKVYHCNNCDEYFVPIRYSKKRYYGHGLMAWVIHQYIVCRVSFANIERTTNDLLGLPLSAKKFRAFKPIAAEYYADSYEKILRKIINGWIIHIDETKVKLQKEEGYVWVLTNMEEVVYFYKSTRETEFLHDLLEDFNGILISDFYTGYDSLKCIQQKCLLHLIRDLNDALLKNPLDDELKKLVITFGSILRNIVGTIDRFGLKTRYLNKHKKDGMIILD